MGEEEDYDDPGVENLLEERGYSWWNANPVYVLKTRHNPDFPGYECMRNSRQICWPCDPLLPSYYEAGTHFRHHVKQTRKRGGSDAQQTSQDNFARAASTVYDARQPVTVRWPSLSKPRVKEKLRCS